MLRGEKKPARRFVYAAVHDTESAAESMKGAKPSKQLLAKMSPERRKRIKEKSVIRPKKMKRANDDCAVSAKLKQD